LGDDRPRYHTPPPLGQPPPWIPFRRHRQNDGPPGGLLPMAHRSASPASRGSPSLQTAPRSERGVAAYSLTSRPCRRLDFRRTGRSRSGSGLPRCHPLSTVSGSLRLLRAPRSSLLLLTSRPCHRRGFRRTRRSRSGSELPFATSSGWGSSPCSRLRGLRREGYKAVAVPFANRGNFEAAT
jgi:hypothetical protein